MSTSTRIGNPGWRNLSSQGCEIDGICKGLPGVEGMCDEEWNRHYDRRPTLRLESNSRRIAEGCKIYSIVMLKRGLKHVQRRRCGLGAPRVRLKPEGTVKLQGLGILALSSRDQNFVKVKMSQDDVWVRN
jgi:hypothetical protein